MKRALLLVAALLPWPAAAQEVATPQLSTITIDGVDLDLTAPVARLDEAGATQATPQQAPPPEPPPRRRPSMVGYVNDATIGSQIRVRFDVGREMPTPDRAEFFYAKCGCYRDLVGDPIFDPDAPGPGPGVVTDLDFQQLYVQAEYAAGNRLSLFGEFPFRWISPQAFVPGLGSFDDRSGFSDLRLGLKLGLVASPEQFLTFQLQAAAPTGEASDGMGTDHWSVEPALLLYQGLSERASLEAQVGIVLPLESSAGVPVTSPDDFAGRVLYYGFGPSFELYHSDNVRFGPVVELVGWRILSGFQTAAPAEADGINIVNLKIGARLVQAERSSFYFGYGKALTDDVWYDDIYRLEYRYAF